MKPANVTRVVVYAAWAWFAIWIGSENPDLGELCALVLIVGGITFGEAVASGGRRSARIITVCAILIATALVTRCTTKALKWETTAVRGVSVEKNFAIHRQGYRSL